jgi:GNAT superfamily N-acetyltransferase
LVRDERLWQPRKGKALLPAQKEDQPMSVKRGRHLSRYEERINEPVGHEADLTFHPLTPNRWQDFETLVGPRGACAGCWCMWWRLTSREFRDGAGVTNRNRFQKCVREPTPPGILAYRQQTVVGWCAVAPREKYRRLAFSRILQPIDDRPVWSITCLYIARSYRRQGLTARLIEAGCELAANFGASTVEAYPRVSPDKPSNPLALYTGTEGSFTRAGFHVVATPTSVRRIMRKEMSR